VARAAIADMPAALRRVIVLRDVRGRSPDEVGEALRLGTEEQRAMLQQARSLVRARLERHFQDEGATR
jgi:DNA-directed RNA polymerase specialized sigma24 family protein